MFDYRPQWFCPVCGVYHVVACPRLSPVALITGYCSRCQASWIGAHACPPACLACAAKDTEIASLRAQIAGWDRKFDAAQDAADALQDVLDQVF